jgi:hypothetical protein
MPPWHVQVGQTGIRKLGEFRLLPKLGYSHPLLKNLVLIQLT